MSEDARDPWLKEYYRTAQARIGQCDSYTFRYKQWLSVVVTALILGSYFGVATESVLKNTGYALVGLLWLAEMTVRTVSLRLRGYALDIENHLNPNARPRQSSGWAQFWDRCCGVKHDELVLAHRLRLGFLCAWGEYLVACVKCVLRPGAIVPYIVAVVVVIYGVPLAAKGHPMRRPRMKSQTEYLTFNTTQQREYINITDEVAGVVTQSGIAEGMVLVSAMHITAGVFVNDAESGLLADIDEWVEHLAPFRKDYRHHRTGETNGDAHLKNLLVHHEVILPITAGRLDLGPWQQVYYAEFDGRRPKRLVIKAIGE